MKVAAVIPCHNEAESIGDVAGRAKQYVDRVIVVDNLSTDRTREEAEKVIPCYDMMGCYTKGAGAATGLGLAFAMSPILWADAVVTLDGDGQHNPDEIPLLLAPLEKGEADVVVGSRFLEEYASPKYRKFGNDVLIKLYNVGHDTRLTDATCCFRAFSRDAVRALLPTEEAGFGFCPEMIVKARARGLRIVEVPVSCIYHDEYKRNSTMNPLSLGLGLVWATLKWRFREEIRR